MCVNAAYKKLL